MLAKKVTKERQILDTSIQIDKYKPASKSQQYLINKQDLYSSNFVLYEFKSGFIKTLIDYYLLIELTGDVPTAMGMWSNKFSKRDQSNIHILNAVTGTLFDSINTSSTEEALRQTEASIYWLLNNFDTELVSIVGEFGSDPVVRFKIFSQKDYGPFLKLISGRKDIIALDGFWNKHSSELSTLIAGKEEFKTPALKSILTNLEKIEADITKANQFRINKGVGDAVIAVDSLGSMILASLDHSFETMMPLLGKPHFILR